MLRHRVRNPSDALVYVTDCNLATIENLATKKSASKYELRRQINIAQAAIDWMREFKIDFSTSRAANIVEQHCGNVEAWAAHWKVRFA